MKNKLLLVAFVLTLGLATKTTQAQVFYEGVNHLNVGVGLGGYGSYAYLPVQITAVHQLFSFHLITVLWTI